MSRLDEIRAKLKAEEDRKTSYKSNKKTTGQKFPFWDMEFDQTSVVRFLPDKNENNSFFWVEKQMLELPFTGIVGKESKPFTLKVPCMKNWGEADRVLQEISPWFDIPEMKDLASKYWIKREFIYSGFVIENTSGEEEPENPIRIFSFKNQIQNIIKSSLSDADFTCDDPVDFYNGLNFKIKKTKNGPHPTYVNSNWSRSTTALSREQLDAIEKYGLVDLSTFMPAKPSEAQKEAIFEMFEASVNGEPYDFERWGAHYRPYGYSEDGSSSSIDNSTSTAKVERQTETVSRQHVEEPEQPRVSAPVNSGDSDEDSAAKKSRAIMEMLAKRKSA